MRQRALPSKLLLQSLHGSREDPRRSAKELCPCTRQVFLDYKFPLGSFCFWYDTLLIGVQLLLFTCIMR